MKSLLKTTVMFCALVAACRADFLLDLGANETGTIGIYYNGTASIVGSYGGQTIGSAILIYDVTDLTENTNLSELTPVVQIGVSWATNEFHDFFAQINATSILGLPPQLDYTADSSPGWATAQMWISNLPPNRHWVALVQTSDNYGGFGPAQTWETAATEMGLSGTWLFWSFSQ